MKISSVLSDFVRSKTGVLWLGMLVTLLYFIVLWSAGTTFRGMGDWILYPVNVLASLVLVMPYLVFRRVWVQISVMAAVQALLVANLMYCRTYFTAIPIDSYGLASNLSDFTSSVVDSLRWADAGFLVITIATAIFARRARRPESYGRSWAVAGCTAAVMMMAAGCGIASKGGFVNEVGRLSQSCYHSTTVVPIYTVAGNLLYQSMSRSTELSEELMAEVAHWQSEHGRLMPYRALPDSVGRRKSLVLVLCESLESWPIEKEVDGMAVTPYLDSLVSDSTTFYAPNVLTQVDAGRSIDAQLLINCGLLPMLHSVYSMKYPGTHYPSLNKAMAEEYGAKSYFFSVDKPITWNQAGVSRSFGCDSLFTRTSWVNDEMIGSPAKLGDRSFLRQCVGMLADSDLWPAGEPRYITVVTYSGHNPFVLPEKYKEQEFDAAVGRFPQRMADYMNMAHYTDGALRTLVEYLRSRPDYGDMLVVITGDHEGLARNRDEILKSPSAQGIVSDGQFTPLVILNSPVAGRYDGVMGQVDIYTTLLNLMGLDNYGWKGMGSSVFSPDRAAFAISSMTGEICGDTISAPSGVVPHVRSARRVSDAMITFDMFE